MVARPLRNPSTPVAGPVPTGNSESRGVELPLGRSSHLAGWLGFLVVVMTTGTPSKVPRRVLALRTEGGPRLVRIFKSNLGT